MNKKSQADFPLGYYELFSFLIIFSSYISLSLPLLSPLNTGIAGAALKSKYGDTTIDVGRKAGTSVGSYSTAEGYLVTAAGLYGAHAEGCMTTSSGGYGAHAEGNSTTASGQSSHASGHGTVASGYGQTSLGLFNISYGNTALLIIGNGSSSTRSNAFRVDQNGAAYGKAAYQSSGADYAEYFEWIDGNPDAEDRRGYFVALDGRKIRKATTDDVYILGIVSAHPVVIGNSDPDNWHQRFLKDDFGNFIMQTVTEKVPIGVDDEGKEVYEEVEFETYIQNPDFDESQDPSYISREKRPEWSPIGMIGVLTMRDDGTCKVDGYCKCNQHGAATATCNQEFEISNGTIRKNYRVLERVSKNLIRVLFR